MNEEFVIYQYDYEGKRISITTLRFQKPKPNRKYTFDVYAGFKVNPDTYSIVLERFALDKWGVICPRSRVIRVPFCKADFDCCHKTNRMMYLSATFCGKRVFYEYHYGTLKHIDKSSKASDEHLPTLNISDSDIPREYRDALL